ncbi:hypothetical protein [Thermanaeromonas sp. C210]|uniref:hypothetical protein n=1 Tax=Thermanaeromonas sp. C210 TaxID=2731925 RepID=UPI00155BCF80|nr:hypothetical protein [Thermanaeromonas sp. C210]GFN23251.1 hypothetical protein TAMC210_15680 [Thermanaeromonas sp. C210]
MRGNIGGPVGIPFLPISRLPTALVTARAFPGEPLSVHAAAFILVWLDFPLLYSSITRNNTFLMAVGFLVLVGAGIETYYFS